MNERIPYPDPWGSYRLSPGERREFDIGGCFLVLHRREDGWEYAFGRKEPDTTPASEPPHEDVDYLTAIAGSGDGVEIRPALADRPLVVRPPSTVTFLPGRRTTLYLDLPLWAGLHIGKHGDEILAEYPVTELSDTWFGDPDNGELAYSYDGEISYDPKPEIAADRALCPLRILNRSTTSLEFQRLCIRVYHLSLYTTGSSFITNEITLVFKGVDQVSQVSYGKDAPVRDREVRRVAVPRIPATQNIIKRSFYFLKSLTT